MKQFFKKQLLAVSAALLTVISVDAQTIPTLEMDANSLPPTSGFGSSLTPMTSILRNDLINNTTFVNNAPEINFTVSLRNQQFTGLNYGGTTSAGASNAQSTGLVFGIGPLTAQDGAIASTGGSPLNRYDFMGAYYTGTGGPQNNMFTTNPTATGIQRGTGMQVLGDPLTGEANGAFQIFTTAQALFGSSNPIGSRVYFGDIVFRFNQPVTNPVIHLAGLGGAYRYCPPSGNVNNAADYLSTFFSTELELVNTGLTSERMSGNTLFSLFGNNILNSNNANPNGGSLDVGNEGIFNNFGAASGSVKLIGTVQEVVYRVYLESGTSSQFAWSVSGSAVINNNRDPFTGDIWYAAASLDKPTQQVSGNVFNDADGLTNLNINTSGTPGVANPKTNAGGLFANLLNGDNVVATTPVSPEGVYLFNNVASGNYTVQISTISGTVGSAAPAQLLPEGWVSTGEFGSTTPGNGAGSDGTVNGRSALFTVSPSDIKTEVNFGIERLPESVSANTTIPTPSVNTIITVNTLTGRDPEDQPTTGVLTGKTIQITTLPTNSQLLYNGVPVVLNQLITNYNPELLQIKFTTATAESSTQFSFAYVDAAGFADRSPATYTVNWTSAGPLPISLTDFTATKQVKVVVLNWQTANEQNSSHFDVEFSKDGNEFKSIGRVKAAGSSSTLKNYSLVHLSPVNGINYYRLKMVDVDGTFKYSAVRTVKYSTTILITAMPNPTTDRVYITSNEAGVLQSVALFSINGKLLQQLNNFTLGKSIDLSNYPASLYILKLVDKNGNTEVIKVVKK